MPWQLTADITDSRELLWGDMLTQEEQDQLPEDYVHLGREHGVPFHPDLPPIPYGLTINNKKRHTTVPAICSGRFAYDIFFDEGMNALIEEMEPGVHFFHPLALYSQSEELFDTKHFLFRAGQLIDGIIPEQSEVVPKHMNGTLRRYLETAVWPKITWAEDAIAGRHLWMDTYFKGSLYCSDAFLEQIQKRNVGHYRTFPSFTANRLH